MNRYACALVHLVGLLPLMQPHDFVPSPLRFPELAIVYSPQSHLHNQYVCDLCPFGWTRFTTVSFQKRFPVRSSAVLMTDSQPPFERAVPVPFPRARVYKNFYILLFLKLSYWRSGTAVPWYLVCVYLRKCRYRVGTATVGKCSIAVPPAARTCRHGVSCRLPSVAWVLCGTHRMRWIPSCGL